MRFAAVFLALVLAQAAHAQSVQRADLPRSDGGVTPIVVSGPADPCAPTVIFSHGLGGQAGFAPALGAAFAARGIRLVAMSHAESGPSVLRGAILSGGGRDALIAAASDPALHAARSRDLDAALTFATRPCRPRRLVLMGHSMGAATTMIEAGATHRSASGGADRFDAYVAVSPQGVGYAFRQGAWRGVRKPVLMITGTRDESADGDWTTRRSAFEGLPPGSKRLAVLPGVGHIALAGRSPEVAATLAALVSEFVGALPGPLPPSRVTGLRIEDR